MGEPRCTGLLSLVSRTPPSGEGVWGGSLEPQPSGWVDAGHERVVDALLKAGADPRLYDSEGLPASEVPPPVPPLLLAVLQPRF